MINKLSKTVQGSKVISSLLVDGDLLVTKDFLAAYYDVSISTIKKWEREQGLAQSEHSSSSLSLYDFKEVQKWYNEYKGITKKPILTNYTDKDDVSSIEEKIKQANEILQVRTTDADEADRVKKIMDALIKAIDAGKASKELIPISDVEKPLIEMVTTLIANYKNDIKILSKDLISKTEEECRNILESNAKNKVERLNALLTKDIPINDTLYDMYYALQNFILEDGDIEKLMDMLRE